MPRETGPSPEEMGIDPESMKTPEQRAREGSAQSFFESHGREWRVGDSVSLIGAGGRTVEDWNIKSFGKRFAVLARMEGDAEQRKLASLEEVGGSIPDDETIRRVTGT